jgi:hypothetical protein
MLCCKPPKKEKKTQHKISFTLAQKIIIKIGEEEQAMVNWQRIHFLGFMNER